MDIRAHSLSWIVEKVSGEAILDVGCVGSPYRNRIPKHVGIDIFHHPSWEPMEKISLMDLPDKQVFDCVICAQVIERIAATTSMEEIFEKLWNIMADKGKLVLVTPLSKPGSYNTPGGEVKIEPVDRLLAILSQRFEVEECEALIPHSRSYRVASLREAEDRPFSYLGTSAYLRAVLRRRKEVVKINVPQAATTRHMPEAWENQLRKAAGTTAVAED